MKKRILALLLAVVQCFSILIVPAYAAETKPLHFELSGPAEAVYPGDEVTVVVSLVQNPGIAMIDAKPVFDKNVFELVKISKVGEMSWTTGTGAFFVEAENTYFTGETLKMVFKVKESAAYGDYTLGLNVELAANENEEIVEGSATTAAIKVAGKPVTGISLDQTTLSLDQGATTTLTATIEPADAGDKTVTWTSSDENVATVANGVVTAKNPGTATITAKAGEFEATCAVTVTGANVPVTGITLGSAPSAIIAGDEIALTATVTPEYATDKTVTWTTSNEAVATVDANGVVTAVGAGSVTITATAGEASATKTFKVFAKLYEATADGETVKLEIPKYDNSNWWYLIKVPAGTKTVGISGVGDLRFVNHGNKNPKNGDCPTGMTYEDGVLYMDLDTYTRNDSYMAGHYGLTYDKYTQRSLEFWGASNWNMTCFFVVIAPCEGEHSWIEANCTEPKRCSNCGTTEGDPLGHDWAETTAKVEPDCENTGTEAIETCQREGCGATQGGAEIAALGHLWKSTGINPAPTCTETGTESFICIRTADCTGTKTETVAALGHTWNEGEVTTEPTCTEKGVKTFHCTVCEDGTKTEDVPANGHNYLDGYCSVCNKKEPTLIPFTKANHTADGAAIHDKFTGVVGLEVDGVTLADWSEWVQGGNYQTQNITIYVAAEDKDKAATITLLLADGQAGSGALINQTATVQLNSGAGSYSATRMKIGTGGLAPQLNMTITFKHELCEEHTWVDANCTTPKTCSVCATTEGDVRPHAYENGACKYEDCTATVPFTVTIDGNTVHPVQTDAVNCTKSSKNVATFDLTIPANAESIVISGAQFRLYDVNNNHKQIANNVTEYSIDLSTICSQLCYEDRSTSVRYHINVICDHNWIDASCTSPKTCSGCGKTEGEALGHDWNEGICTREGCGVSNVITEIEVSHPKIEKNEETGAMTMAMVAGSSEKIDLSFGLVDEGVASTQVVAWFVTTNDTDAEGNPKDPASIATVNDGVVTAVGPGTVTITAKAVDVNGIALLADGEEIKAQFTLTVTDPEAGYTVTMGDDVLNTVIGSNVSVSVTVGHTGDVTVYNAFDLTFEYDPTILELTSTTIQGMNVTVNAGKIHVERYGTELTVGQPALTLTFKAIATGEINVKVTSAKVDISESALMNDAPDAAIIDELTRVSVAGYTVTLPTDFTGESSVLPGEDYTFTAKDKNYDYDVTAKIGDSEITVTDNGDGTFTIDDKDITGNIVITTEKSGKVFNVTLGDDMTGAETAQYMAEGGYTATLTKDAGYNYNVTVTIGGVKYTGLNYSEAANDAGVMIGTITIPGEAITGEIVFNSNKTGKTVDKHSVQFTGEYGDIAEGTLMEVENGADYVLTINKVVGYKYTVTATMGGETAEVIDNNDGTYTIKNVTGDLVITITKESDLVVEVKEYVTLNGKTMFLVTATATVDNNKVLSYDGTAMFYSNQYNAWSYLVITDTTLSVDDAKAKITLNEGTKVELNQTYNVNETANETVDINDAQLVFDMYNNVYQNFDNATMQKFLKADVNGDKAIDVNDAAAIVSEIVKAK